MKKLGRFSKFEFIEIEDRFNLGQSIYKIGREMQRSHIPIERYLISKGLLEKEPEIIYSKNLLITLASKYEDLIILSFLFIVLPSLGLIFMGYLLLKD